MKNPAGLELAIKRFAIDALTYLATQLSIRFKFKGMDK